LTSCFVVLGANVYKVLNQKIEPFKII